MFWKMSKFRPALCLIGALLFGTLFFNQSSHAASPAALADLREGINVLSDRLYQNLDNLSEKQIRGQCTQYLETTRKNIKRQMTARESSDLDTPISNMAGHMADLYVNLRSARLAKKDVEKRKIPLPNIATEYKENIKRDLEKMTNLYRKDFGGSSDSTVKWSDAIRAEMGLEDDQDLTAWCRKAYSEEKDWGEKCYKERCGGGGYGACRERCNKEWAQFGAEMVRKCNKGGRWIGQ